MIMTMNEVQYLQDCNYVLFTDGESWMKKTEFGNKFHVNAKMETFYINEQSGRMMSEFEFDYYLMNKENDNQTAYYNPRISKNYKSIYDCMRLFAI